MGEISDPSFGSVVLVAQHSFALFNSSPVQKVDPTNILLLKNQQIFSIK